MRAVVLSLLTLAATASSAHAQGNPRDFDKPGPRREREMYYAQVRMEINNVLVRWRDAWERDDAAKLAGLYAEAASYYPTTAGVAQTRPAIRNFFEGFLRTVTGVTVQMTGFGTSGDLAWLTARVSYRLQGPSAPGREQVRTDMIVLRRRQSLDWEIETHMAQTEPEEKPLP